MSKFRMLAALSLASGALAACSEVAETPLATLGDAPAALALIKQNDVNTACATGTITVNDGDKLSGQVVIPSGCTFKVNPADLSGDSRVTILGDASVLPSVLVISKGAKIDAQGTATVPIVFTSSKAAGSRAPADWGGIVIIGNAQANCGATCKVEGIPGDTLTYGGSNDADDSGVMKYVRIEFAGYQLVTDKELNALSLYGVGSGTQLSYIQAHRGSDDGIEFFGGTVDLKYAIATGNEDDSFDYSYGYRGDGQFWIAQQLTTVGDKGIEADNDDAGSANTPLTSPNVCNVTLVGRSSSIADSTTVHTGNFGIQQRRQVADSVYSAVVLGFDFARDESSAASAFTGSSIFWAKAGYDAIGTSSISQVNPALSASVFNRTSPDFRYGFNSPAATGGECPWAATNSFFSAVNYRGGVGSSSAAAWYAGWITTAAN